MPEEKNTEPALPPFFDMAVAVSTVGEAKASDFYRAVITAAQGDYHGVDLSGMEEAAKDSENLVAKEALKKVKALFKDVKK